MNDKIEVGEYGRTNLGNILIFAWLVYGTGLGFDCIEYKGAIKVLQELLEDKI